MSRKRRSRKQARASHRPQHLGTPPGTLVADPEAPAPVIRIMAYGAERCVEQSIDQPQQIHEFLGKWPVIWVNVDGLGDANKISQIGKIFGLHPLALEDVLNVHQRPKVEQYGQHHFMVARMASFAKRLDSEQVSLFLGKNFVLTFQERAGDSFEQVRQRLRTGRGRIRQTGADYLAYSLLDAVVDGYFPVLESLGDRLEALEDALLARSDVTIVSQIHEAKHDLLTLRRAVWPLRDAINSLFPDATDFVSEETRVYLRDCYDHTIRIIDLVETYREIAASLTDLYISGVSNRMNEIMKVLTIIATLFIPLTFIVGVYGMNFEYMPELHWRWGYPLSLCAMAIIAAALLLYFRRKRWIGSP